MKTVFCICASIMVVTFSHAQETKDFGLSNGYDWLEIKTLSETIFSRVDWTNKKEWIDNVSNVLKTQHIRGMFVIIMTLPQVNYVKIVPGEGRSEFYMDVPNGYEFTSDVTDGQFVKGLDQIYSDYRNLNVRIVDAMRIVQMEIKGKDPKDIDWQLRYYKADEETRRQMAREKYEKFKVEDIPPPPPKKKGKN